MLDNLLNTYNISSGTLKEIFPEHAVSIDRIDELEDSTLLTAALKESLNEIALDLLTEFSSYKNQKRITDYLSVHPDVIGKIEKKSKPEIPMNEEENLMPPAIAQAPLAQTPVEEEEDENLFPTSATKPVVDKPAPIISEDAPIVTAPFFPILNDTDTLYYENFKINSLPKLLSIMPPIDSLIGHPRVVDYLINAKETGTTITIDPSLTSYFIQQGWITPDQKITPFGVKIRKIYNKCFPFDMHPFCYVYKSRKDMFPSAIIDIKTTGAIYIKINGQPFIYNGSTLLEIADNNFTEEGNFHDKELETMVISVLDRGTEQPCKPTGYCLDITTTRENLNIEGGRGLGYVNFDLLGAGRSVDSLTFNYLRFRYGNELDFVRYATGSETESSFITVFNKNQEREIAILISDPSEDNFFNMESKGTGLSDEEFVLKRIKQDYPVDAQLVEYSEFLKRDGGQTVIVEPAVMDAQGFEDVIASLQIVLKTITDKDEKKKIREQIADLKMSRSIVAEYSNAQMGDGGEIKKEENNFLWKDRSRSGENPFVSSESQIRERWDLSEIDPENEESLEEFLENSEPGQKWNSGTQSLENIGKQKMQAGGKIGFEGLQHKVSKEYQHKGYSKSKADEIGKKTAGKVYQKQQHMGAGGTVNSKHDPLGLDKGDRFYDLQGNMILIELFDKNKKGYWAKNEDGKPLWTGDYNKFHLKYSAIDDEFHNEDEMAKGGTIKNITAKKIKELAKKSKLDISKFSMPQIIRGFKIEMEHGSQSGKKLNVTHDNPTTTLKIALAHLKERPDYYKLLEKVENDKPTKK